MKNIKTCSMLETMWQKITLNIRLYSYLKRFEKEALLSNDKIKEIQFKRLKQILIKAYENHQFYKNRFDSCGFDPYNIKNIDNIKLIPVLTKEEYRNFTNEEISKNPNKYNNFYKDGTSGSTGMPLKIYRTWKERAYMVSKWMRVLTSNGYSTRDITFSIPSPHRLQKDSVIQKLGIAKRISVPYTESEKVMVEEYIKHKPSVLYANKSQLQLMALYCINNNITVPKPKFYVSAAETMDENTKSLITSVFGKENLVQVYGAVEFNTIAWQQKNEDFYRVSHTTNLIETNTKNNECIITDLFIQSFPLIRYSIGDIINQENIDGLPVIKKIKGRQDDFVTLKDGSKIPFHIFYEIMEKRLEIKQFRVIQEDYQIIKIEMVKDPASDKNSLTKILEKDLQKSMPDKEMTYIFDWKEQILPEANGKIRMLVSHVKAKSEKKTK